MGNIMHIAIMYNSHKTHKSQLREKKILQDRKIFQDRKILQDRQMLQDREMVQDLHMSQDQDNQCFIYPMKTICEDTLQTTVCKSSTSENISLIESDDGIV